MFNNPSPLDEQTLTVGATELVKILNEVNANSDEMLEISKMQIGTGLIVAGGVKVAALENDQYLIIIPRHIQLQRALNQG